MVNSVMIDPAYHGRVCDVALAEVPAKRADLGDGKDTLDAPSNPTTAAVRITEVLGEGILLAKQAGGTASAEWASGECS